MCLTDKIYLKIVKEKIKMKYKPHILQSTVSIIRTIILMLIFYVLAIIISNSSYEFTISFYMFFLAKDAEIYIDQKYITLNIGFGKVKTISIQTEIIKNCYIKQNIIEKLLNLYSLKLDTDSQNAELQKNISTINQYMIFSKETANKIMAEIKNNI